MGGLRDHHGGSREEGRERERTRVERGYGGLRGWVVGEREVTVVGERGHGGMERGGVVGERGDIVELRDGGWHHTL